MRARSIPCVIRLIFRTSEGLTASTFVMILAVIVLAHFPFHTDPDSFDSPTRLAEKDRAAKDYYDSAYEPSEQDNVYIRTEKLAAEQGGVLREITAFASQYQLQHKRVLEVGAGTGSLQDVVDDYTALDISSNVRKYFHKPFVQGSATSLPFRDSEFDAIWSIWVLEHVPHPEHALREMRRVLRPNGILYLGPAWHCPDWAADGYDTRSYSDFGAAGKLVKASLVLRKSAFFRMLQIIPVRLIRSAGYKVTRRPTRFRYRLLKPNYQHYWQPDSDALNSMDSYEAYLWFISRGDKCLNCRGEFNIWNTPDMNLVIQIKK